MNTNPNDGAYPAPTALANSGPKERQEAFDALKEELDDALAELAALRAELEREVKNKKEFERDWLDACDRLSQAEAERDALRAALDWYGEKAKEMGKAALHSDSKRMLSLMHELAVDYGKRAALGER